MKKSVVRELRSVPRYSVSLPVYITWRAPGTSHHPLNALTRDISTRGMFVAADSGPAEGELLEFEIDMALDAQTPLVVVHGEGRVVRTERPSQQPAGFAVQNLWFRLREPEQGQALPIDFQSPASADAGSPLSAGKTDRHRGLTIVPRPVNNDSDRDCDQGVSK